MVDLHIIAGVFVGILITSLEGHPCDGVTSGTYTCDPATNGSDFFLCRSNKEPVRHTCQSPLRFNNAIQSCDWPQNSQCRYASESTKPTTKVPPPTTLFTLLTTTTTASTKTAPSGHPCDSAKYSYVCKPPTGSSYYYYCPSGSEPVLQKCPQGLTFNNAAQACDWPENSECPGQSEEVPRTTTKTTTTPRTTTTTTKTTTTPRTGTTTTRTTRTSTSTTTLPPVTGPCNTTSCQLPNCRCPGTSIPGNLPLKDVPQMIILTFDDGVNPGNFHFYTRLFGTGVSRNNPNGCPAKATFFVSGDYVDMQQVKAIADKGHEIASHTRTHSSLDGQNLAAVDKEVQGMREDLAIGTGQSLNQIRGFRSPYLAPGGNNLYQVLQERGFLYDSSLYTGSLKDDGASPLWWYTLDYPVVWPVCDNYGCPTKSYPGLWEVPLIRQYTVSGSPCSMTDDCNLGQSATVNDVVNFLTHNFNRHYSTNRSPFMISLHATWFSRVSSSLQGLEKFLEGLAGRNDVWQVSVTQALDWVRKPLPLSRLAELTSWQC